MRRKKITGETIIEILEKAYDEYRYPVPEPISKKYPITKNGKVLWDPLGATEPREFAFKVGLEVIIKIEQDFSISIPRERLPYSINEDDWIRFRRLFFKDIEMKSHENLRKIIF